MAVVGEDGVISESHPLSDAVLGCIPTEVGLWRQQVVYSCLDASQQYLAVGSVQGYVWVVDLQSARLLREFSEFKGSSITVVKLNPVRDCLAYGTNNGYVRVERISRAVATKWRVQEKGHTSVSALEWGTNGDDLYCGFASGRLIQFRLRFVDGDMSHVPLPENFGSHVIQLSSSVDTLLISTMERALVLDTKTHKLDQVGRKDRKPGPYGGYLVHGGQKAYLSRPGLRMWAADSDGKVTHTVAFKEALSTRHLPTVPLHNWSPLAACYNKAWQFTQLYPWVADQFIVTYFEDTLFVLDPEGGEIVGVLSLEYPINSLAATGVYVYLLSTKAAKPIIRIAVHPSLSKGKVLLPSRLSFHISDYKIGSGTPLYGSRELLDEVKEREEINVQDETKSASMNGVRGEDTPDGGSTLTERDGQRETERMENTPDTGKAKKEEEKQLADLQSDLERKSWLLVEETQPVASDQSEESAGQHLKEDTPESALSDASKSHENASKSHENASKSHEDSSSTSSVPATTTPDPPKPTLTIPLPLNLVKEDLKEIKELLKPKFGKLAGLLSGSTLNQSSTTATDKVKDETTPGELQAAAVTPERQPSPSPHLPAPPRLEREEQARRLRMAQMDDMDEVVVVATSSPRPHYHKKKKKRKHKKISSATSSKSVSLERLTDIADDQNLEDTPTPPSMTTTPTHPLVFTKEQEAKLAAFERKQQAELEAKRERVVSTIHEEHDDSIASPAVQSSNDNLPISTGVSDAAVGLTSSQDIPPVVVESPQLVILDLDHDVSAPHGNIERECESGQSLPVEDLAVQELTNRGCTTSEELSKQDHTTGEELTTQDHPPLEKAIDEAYAHTSLEYHHFLGGSSSNERSTRSPFEEDMYDNPLYHDSEEDFSVGGGEDAPPLNRECATVGSRARPKELAARIQKRRSLSVTLQDTIFDPLQSDEYPNEGAMAHARYSSSPEAVPTLLSQTPQVHVGVWNKQKERGKQEEHPAKQTELNREALFEGSDSSRDSPSGLDDSQVEPDFYQLCGALIKDSSKPDKDPLMAGISSLPTRPKRVELLAQASEEEESYVMTANDKESSTQSADIWVPILHPSRYHLQCVCLSDMLLWVVDSRSNVFCTSTDSKGKDWQNIKKAMQLISSSHSGHVVWGLYRQNAYIRLGIGLNQAGSTWRNNTKGTPLAHKIKHLSVDENGVWVVTTDGRMLFRKGVSESNPEGKVWQEVSFSDGFSYVSCCRGIVWAMTSTGKVFIREGITSWAPSGKKWVDVKTPRLSAVSITKAGVVWCINHDGSIGFRCGVSSSKPNGKGPWWEVKINALTHPSSPYNSLWQVMSYEGSHVLASVSSLVTSLPGLSQNKLVTVSASSNAGVVVLEGGNKLHACWRSATGYHYTTVCKNDLFQFITWTHLAAGSSALWLVRDDGDLYCLSPGEKLKRIECPSKVELIAASPTCMWVVSRDMVWSRQGMSKEYPDGISFDYIELSTQLHERKLCQVVCGKKSVWAIDNKGVPHFRFGVHAREPGTGMAPAWIAVEDNPKPLSRIAVNPDDWLVWACDENYNVFVRVGVTQDFPVGRKWEPVPTQRVREICATNDKIYALTPSGELLCRYGISQNNVQGNYWRRMPGDYGKITTGASGDLWVLDRKGKVWKQEWKVISVSEKQSLEQHDFEKSMVVIDQSWEVV